MKNHYYKFALFFIVIFSFIVRFFVYGITDNVGEDTAVKIFETQKWLESPHIITSGIWLPFSYYLIALSLLIWNNAIHSPRLISLITGVLSVLPFFGIVRLLFGKKEALISAFLLSIYSLHIIYSVISMTEVPFVFFILCSMYFFLAFLKEENYNKLNFLFSIVFLFLSSMMRFEAWIFIPIMPLFLFINKKRKEAFIFLFLTSLFPISWVAGCYLAFNDYLPIATININKLNIGGMSIWQKFFNYPYRMLKYLTPAIFLISFWGMIKCIIKKVHFEIAVLLLIQFAFLVSIVFYGTNASPRPRYSILMSVFLLVYFSEGFKAFSNLLKSKLIVVVICAVSYISTTYYSFYIKHDSITPVLTKESKEFCSWIKENIPENKKILFLNCIGGDPIIALYAGLSWKNVSWVLRDPANVIISPERSYSAEASGIEKFLIHENPTYIATSKPSELNGIENNIIKSKKLKNSFKSRKILNPLKNYYLMKLE